VAHAARPVSVLDRRSSSPVRGQQPKGLLRGENPETSLVQRQDDLAGQPSGEHEDRCIGETDLKIAVLPGDLPRQPDLVRRERREIVDAPGDLVEHRELRVAAREFPDEVVQFGEDEREQRQRSGRGQHLAAHQAAHDEEGGPAERSWLADAVGFAYATASAALLLRPGAARFRRHPDGWPDRIELGELSVAVAAGHPWAGQDGVQVVEDAQLAAVAVGALTAAAEPIVAACRGLARVGRTALWAEVADGFGLPVLFQLDLPVDPVVAQRLQEAVRTPGRPWRQVPHLRAAATELGRTYFGRKAGCCLAYRCRTADEPDPATLTERQRAHRERFPRRPDEPRYCSTCSLRDLGGCKQRQLFWLEQERAARD